MQIKPYPLDLIKYPFDKESSFYYWQFARTKFVEQYPAWKRPLFAFSRSLVILCHFFGMICTAYGIAYIPTAKKAVESGIAPTFAELTHYAIPTLITLILANFLYSLGLMAGVRKFGEKGYFLAPVLLIVAVAISMEVFLLILKGSLSPSPLFAFVSRSLKGDRQFFKAHQDATNSHLFKMIPLMVFSCLSLFVPHFPAWICSAFYLATKKEAESCQ